MKAERCGLCRFFRERDAPLSNPLFGEVKMAPRSECRRRAPFGAVGVGFPFVQAEDWCGEFEACTAHEKATPDA